MRALTPTLSPRETGRGGAGNPFSLGEKVASEARRMRVTRRMRANAVTRLEIFT